MPKAAVKLRAVVGLIVALGILAASLAADAQRPTKVPRVGFLGASLQLQVTHVQAFVQGLRELGYVEGQNIALEYRWNEGKLERIPDNVADLVRLRVDVIVSASSPTVLAAKQATSTIPIVMAGLTDPVGAGLVASLARPGGNITGLSLLATELSGKRLELLKEVVPEVTRVAVLFNPTHPGQALALKETQVACSCQFGGDGILSWTIRG